MKTEPHTACPNCETGRLHKGVRSVKIACKGLNATVKNVAGLFCDHCDEIEFDESTDSAKRYAAAGDNLVLQYRAEAAATLKLQRRRLKLTQAQACLLTGGGTMRFPGITRVRHRLFPPFTTSLTFWTGTQKYSKS